MLRAQDILVCLHLAVTGHNKDERTTYASIAESLRISIGTAHAAAQRARSATLLDEALRPVRSNLLEFLSHGLRYVFYPERGSIVRGVPAGAAAPFICEELAHTPENSPVWPHSTGRARGYALEPLYPTVPEIALSNPRLHGVLAAVELLRIGTARERAVAVQFLKKVMAPP